MVEEKITGVMIYYYFVCQRKLWFSLYGIAMESENENVQIGKALDELSYKNERKHIAINNEINLDFVKQTGMIHEIKKSRQIEEASIWQVKYYLYYLKKRHVTDLQAKIDYPLLKKSLEVNLSLEDEKVLEKVITEIKALSQDSQPQKVEKTKKCLKCAYHDLCFV